MSRWVRPLVLFLCFISTVACADEKPIEDRPYRVQVAVSFEANPEFNAAWQSEILAELGAGIERCTGLLWDCQVTREQGTLFSGVPSLLRLRSEAFTRTTEFDDTDKVYPLAIVSAGAGCRILGREWDASTRALGSVAEEQVLERRELATGLLKLLHRLFRPLVEVDQPRQGPTSLRAQAGNLSNPESDWGALTAGMLFEASYRMLDQNLADKLPQQWAHGPAEAMIARFRAQVTAQADGASPAVELHR